jgi:ATP-dependent RNA helicase DeaD
LWVGIGRKDNVKPGDLVGALVNEAKVPAESIGKIEVKDLFCLVDIRSDVIDRAAAGLTGATVRGRRIIARVDRGPAAAKAGGRPPRRGS